MKREEFVNVAEEALGSLPEEFRSRIKNVAILVEDFPPNQLPPEPGQQIRLVLGIFHGVPATNKSVSGGFGEDGIGLRADQFYCADHDN